VGTTPTWQGSGTCKSTIRPAFGRRFLPAGVGSDGHEGMVGRAFTRGRGRFPGVAGLIGLMFAIAVLAGPGASAAEAGQCKGSDTAGFRLSEGEARKATLCLINRERKSRGMSALRSNGKQQRAASGHNRAMLKKNCFGHQCPGERDLVGRIEQAGYLPCGCSWSVAENIAWGKGGASSPREIVDSWMNSAGHRANILSSKFEHIGIAVDGRSPGGGGGAATYTTDFGYKR
jgi:uncharacterized protein YkwD